MNSKLTGEADEAVQKKILPYSALDMKTKVVQHVPRIIFSVFKVFEFSGFQVFKFSKNSWFPAFV